MKRADQMPPPGRAHSATVKAIGVWGRKNPQEARNFSALDRRGCRIADSFLRFRANSRAADAVQQMLLPGLVVAATCIATTLEKRRPLPGDGMVPNPIFTSTHAVTIDAPPEDVWPWIAQMGGGRAGWYSWGSGSI